MLLRRRSRSVGVEPKVTDGGEQPLPPFGACNLGSINLTKFVSKPFQSDATFDWATFEEVVRIFTRMLDNVVEINGLPLAEQREEILAKRRHGMGFMGLGSTLVMLGMRYGDHASVAFTARVAQTMALEGWRVALALAKEKGPAPALDQAVTLTGDLLRKQPRLVEDGYKAGEEVPAAVLHAKYSVYMEKIGMLDPDLVEDLAKVGARFTHHTSIAPTGTIALSLGNNVSNGIEPSFAHLYSRNVIREGRKTKEKVDVCSYELLAYRAFVNPDASPETTEDANRLPEVFVSADSLAPQEHIAVQQAAQYWVDSSISKTINVATDISFEDFQDVYLHAAKMGLKGCTTFRFNPQAFQGVLVRESDLAATHYTFTLDDGSEVTFAGNEDVDYEGEVQTAANLFDALKEGYYGRL